LQNDTRRDILITIFRKPGITNQDLTQAFDLAKSTVHWHINELCNEGFVHFKTDGKYKRYFIKPEIKTYLEKILLASDFSRKSRI
jgi:predicted transcriptional regulator